MYFELCCQHNQLGFTQGRGNGKYPKEGSRIFEAQWIFVLHRRLGFAIITSAPVGFSRRLSSNGDHCIFSRTSCIYLIKNLRVRRVSTNAMVELGGYASRIAIAIFPDCVTYLGPCLTLRSIKGLGHYRISQKSIFFFCFKWSLRTSRMISRKIMAGKYPWGRYFFSSVQKQRPRFLYIGTKCFYVPSCKHLYT